MKKAKRKSKNGLFCYTPNTCKGSYMRVTGCVVQIHDPLTWETGPCPACFWYREAKKAEASQEALEILLPF